MPLKMEMNADDKFWARVLNDEIEEEAEATTEDIIMRGMAHIMQELHEINEKLDELSKNEEPVSRDSDDSDGSGTGNSS